MRKMKIITAQQIVSEVADACVQANRVLPADLEQLIKTCGECESCPIAKGIFSDMLDNIDAAKELELPVCQDTGMAVVFAEVGQEVCIEGGSFEQAINDGVAKGYVEGKLRCSVVSDPLERVNTGDNTPAIIHTRIVPGDRLKITVAPKGFGSENMSRLKMLTPASGRQAIIDFVTETVKLAGGRPCPPLVVGVGIGGDFEYCALLAKKALCRPVSSRNADEYYQTLEEDILAAVNGTGVGAQGFGGDITALCVNVEAYPTHIAGLPVAVNIGCHVTRHKTIIM